jgi:membrane-anchored protein YejM (alkaline phosphatase superfamily)
MDPFVSFLILLVISVVVSGVLHYGFKLTSVSVNNRWAFITKVVGGYYGAWWGPTVFGKWWSGLNYGDVYYIPAILGCFSLIVFGVALFKALRGGK